MSKQNSLILLYPEVAAPKIVEPPGYYVRTYENQDFTTYKTMLRHEGWILNDHQFHDFFNKVVSNGLFFAIDKETNEIAATAVALRNPTSTHFSFLQGGEIGFVITKREHRRKGLGSYVTALATSRLISTDSKSIRIVVNDFRTAAIKTYLNLGFKPFLYTEDMEKRWEEVFHKLNRKLSIENCMVALKNECL
ncbi:GNAT family N-acetyltransferase [Bacillus sp. BGMRC 2118]|nr:GNAT family N-acetyltransferase [Bacillus sp. BGMRC 2118]